MEVQCVLLLLTLASFVVLINGETSHDEVKKRDVPVSEMDAIFADDNKQKRSEEVMFGNQQNKPAGMIDDALSGMVGKKREIKKKASTDNSQSESEENGAPIISEGGVEDKTNNLEGNEEQPDAETEFSDNELPRDFPMSDYEGLEDEPMLREAWYQYRNLKRSNDWQEYPPLFNGIYRRRRRGLLARDIRSPLEKLLISDKGGRFKRDLHMSEDDMLNLLGILAEDPRLQQVLHDSEWAPGEMPNEADFLGDIEGTANDEEEELLPTLAEYYGSMINDDNANREEVPEWALMGPAARLEMRRRSFYPPMDYRVLGLPGQKRDGLWGQLEDQHRARLYPTGFNDPEELEVPEPYMENVMDRGDLDEPMDIYRRLML